MRRSLFLAFILLCGSVLMVYSGQGIHTTTEIDDAVDIAQAVGLVSGIIEADGAGNISAATAGTDYYAPGGVNIPVADGGTGAGTALGARSNLGVVIGTDVLAPAGDGSSLTGITASQITDKHASTDITADLEEETHASEHAVSAADTIFPTDPNDDQYLMWDDDPGELVWIAVPGVTDLDDLPGDTVDDNLIDWAIVDTAVVDATTGDSATAFFDAGTIEHEYGGLEADVSAYSGLVSITGGATASVNSLADLNTLITDATILDDGAIADSTEIGLATGATYTFGDAADDSLNELFDAIDTAIDGLPGGHAAVTLAVGVNALTLSTQEIDIAADVEAIADGAFGTTAFTGLAAGSTYTFGDAGDDTLDEMFDAIDTMIDDHSAQHIVSGADTIFPADPGSDLFLMWDDVPGELVWSAATVADSTITASKMADADHGHVSWTSTFATVEDFALTGSATVGDDIKISFGADTDANFEWDTATTPDQFMLDLDNAAIDSEYLITNSDGTYEANLTVEGDIESASGVFIGDGSSLTGVQLTDADVTSIAGGVSGLVYGGGDGSGYSAATLAEGYIWVGNAGSVPTATTTLSDVTLTNVPVVSLNDVILDPDSTDDFVWTYVEYTTTVTDIFCFAEGSSPNISLTVSKCTNADCSTDTAIESAITCNGSQDEDDGTIDSGSISAGTWLKVDLTLNSGTVTSLAWYVKGTQTW